MSHTWFVGFPTRDTAATRRALAFWRPFTRPGYRHVLLWRAAGPGTLWLNWIAPRFEADWEPTPVAEWTRRMVEAGVWTLAVPAEALPPPPAAGPPPFAFATCVSVAQHALGLRAWWCLTPRALARLLTRRGAVPVLPHPRHPQPQETPTWAESFPNPKAQTLR